MISKNPDNIDIYEQSVTFDDSGNPVFSEDSNVNVDCDFQESRPGLKITNDVGETISIKGVIYITKSSEITKFNTLSNPKYISFDGNEYNILKYQVLQKHIEIYY